MNEEDLDTLLENSGWVRQLARRLLWDKTMVDDVVQEVWITALEKPPREPRALRRWLAVVVHALSRRANRTEVRRRQRETRSAHAQEGQRSVDIVSELETQQLLAREVGSLEDPYRTVIYLHFFQGLRANEIARLQEIPASTVRSQLSRGLGQLRERLDRVYGDRKRWRAGLIALVGMPEGLLELWSIPEPFDGTSLVASLRVSFPVLALLIAVMGVLTFTQSYSASDWSDGLASDEKPLQRDASKSWDHSPPARSATPESSSPEIAARSTESSAGVELPTLLVLDLGSGLPITGASVHTMDRLDPEPTLLGETDQVGTLEISVEQLKSSAFVITAPGYREARYPTVVRDFDSTEPYAFFL